jgi:hypothetical protein
MALWLAAATADNGGAISDGIDVSVTLFTLIIFCNIICVAKKKSQQHPCCRKSEDKFFL